MGSQRVEHDGTTNIHTHLSQLLNSDFVEQKQQQFVMNKVYILLIIKFLFIKARSELVWNMGYNLPIPSGASEFSIVQVQCESGQ